MIELRLPSFGADMDDAEFVQWNVQPGQAVARGDIACVVETQKGAIDVEVWQDGTVARLIAEPGQRLPVGSPLALLAEAHEDWRTLADAAPAAAGPAPPSTPAAATATAPAPDAAAAPSPAGGPPLSPTGSPERAGGPRASPAARRRARELGVDLDALAARVGDRPLTLSDIESAAAAAPAAGAPSEGSAMREAIAAAMARSKREIPHYYLAREAVVEPALRWLEGYNAARPPAERMLFAAMLLRAVALALADAPTLNGRCVGGRFQPSATVDLAVVTSLRRGGLVIPTLHDAARLPLPQLMAALNDVLARARGGRLRSSDLGEATISVSNLGDLGADAVHGVIYPPQVALVGAGRIASRAIVQDGRLIAARTVQLTLAADHRVSDGATGARFLATLVERLDHPEDL
ncbi:2-oxo acid dehydrogenase subunit E2 [Aquabacterium humicola]|uniref:2-oxo acid dehydrogenase subunit E2 n=1 Tax=Aquabacterium humicola TaxID=3237377 RepID=UPI002542DC2E|nr:2-oxo acid dehydrogenase subunit E2 [Rubrivivax pictus]